MKIDRGSAITGVVGFPTSRGRDDKARFPSGTGRPSARATHYRDSRWRAHEIKLRCHWNVGLISSASTFSAAASCMCGRT
jgi:hypothetical protein